MLGFFCIYYGLRFYDFSEDKKRRTAFKHNCVLPLNTVKPEFFCWIVCGFVQIRPSHFCQKGGVGITE